MNRIFKVYLAKAGSASEASAGLDLPAGPHALLDALDKARLGPEDKLYMEVSEYYKCEFLAPYLYDDCDLYALNALAGHLSEMEDRNLTAFEGLLQMEVNKREGPITMQKLCDLAVSVDCCHVVGEALNDSQLGRFYAENSFVPEVENLPDAVFELLDFEKIGRQARLGEGGVFTERGYVIQSGEPRQAPPVPTGPPQKPDHVFQLILDNYPFDEDNHKWLHIPLNLPATEEELDAALGKLDAPSWDEVICTDYDGTIPNLRDMTDDVFLDIEQLNEFSAAVRKVEQAGRLTKYKAVLEATECTDLDIAATLADRLDEYVFDPNISGFTELAEDELRFSVSEDTAELLKKHLNLYQYGQDILKQENAAITSYGLIQRGDGQPVNIMEQLNQQRMEMNME